MTEENSRSTDLEILDQVDLLNDEVKKLALNLAIYLAKAKGNSDELNRLEPEFMKLINGSVKVVQELALIISAARNAETMAYDVPSGANQSDRIETKLNSILQQCQDIMRTLAKQTDITI
ncbi:MAG: hypothetical protein JSU74_08765 [Candidatus Zixiibacteriota bacterium]|nr:MAG: hypothetical protein JSU74_08765 [candidate division Zixibacteria bacterium]